MKISIVLLCLLIPVHLWLSSTVLNSKGALDGRYVHAPIVSGKILRFTALEFKSLAADNKLLEGIFYIGRLLVDDGRTLNADWDYFTSLADAAVELDPYFFDTYYFTSSMLAWNGLRPDSAVEILHKAAVYRPNDHRLLFNLGFIYYYFLNDKASAAEYMQRAAQVGGAPAFYANLAARLAFDSGNHETAAAFLVTMIEQTQNGSIKAMYEKRLTALTGAIKLEQLLHRYKEETGKDAASLSELLEKGYLNVLPIDPYGGEYYINEKGRVYSTSGFTSQIR